MIKQPTIPPRPTPKGGSSAQRETNKITVDVEVETEGLDEALEKTEELTESLGEIQDRISIKYPKDCTFIFNMWREP